MTLSVFLQIPPNNKSGGRLLAPTHPVATLIVTGCQGTVKTIADLLTEVNLTSAISFRLRSMNVLRTNPGVSFCSLIITEVLINFFALYPNPRAGHKWQLTSETYATWFKPHRNDTELIPRYLLHLQTLSL